MRCGLIVEFKLRCTKYNLGNGGGINKMTKKELVELLSKISDDAVVCRIQPLWDNNGDWTKDISKPINDINYNPIKNEICLD